MVLLKKFLKHMPDFSYKTIRKWIQLNFSLVNALFWNTIYANLESIVQINTSATNNVY